MHHLPAHSRSGRSAFRFLRKIVASVAIAGATLPPSFAADQVNRPVAPRPGVSDAMLARTALAALDADVQLRDVNVVVSVVDRVAVIGGSVPSPELSMRAEAVVRKVNGIEVVKNRCFVQSQPDPLIRAVADRLNPNAGGKPVAHDLPGMVRPPRPMSVEGAYSPPPTAVAVKPASSSPTVNPQVVSSMKIASNTAIRPNLLGDPISAPGGPRVAAEVPVPTVSPVPARLATTPAIVPVSVPTRPTDVMGSLLDLRKSEPRFAGLLFEMKDGVISLTGTSPKDGDAWDFADKARRLPGVKQVVVGKVNLR